MPGQSLDVTFEQLFSPPSSSFLTWGEESFPCFSINISNIKIPIIKFLRPGCRNILIFFPLVVLPSPTPTPTYDTPIPHPHLILGASGQ